MPRMRFPDALEMPPLSLRAAHWKRRGISNPRAPPRKWPLFLRQDAGPWQTPTELLIPHRWQALPPFSVLLLSRCQRLVITIAVSAKSVKNGTPRRGMLRRS